MEMFADQIRIVLEKHFEYRVLEEQEDIIKEDDKVGWDGVKSLTVTECLREISGFRVL